MNSTPKATDEVAMERAGRYAYVNFGKLNDARDEAQKQIDSMTNHADAFRALADLLIRKNTDSLELSASGRDGLSFICEMLSDSMYDAIIEGSTAVEDMRRAITFDHASKARDEEEASND